MFCDVWLCQRDWKCMCSHFGNQMCLNDRGFATEIANSAPCNVNVMNFRSCVMTFVGQNVVDDDVIRQQPAMHTQPCLTSHIVEASHTVGVFVGSLFGCRIWWDVRYPEAALFKVLDVPDWMLWLLLRRIHWSLGTVGLILQLMCAALRPHAMYNPQWRSQFGATLLANHESWHLKISGSPVLRTRSKFWNSFVFFCSFFLTGEHDGQSEETFA